MFKKLAAIVALLLAVAMVLGACGETTNNSSTTVDNSVAGNDSSVAGDDSSVDTPDPVTVTYGGWEGQLMMLEMADKFNDLYPHITVEITHTGWMGNSQLAECFATNAVPDVVNYENPFVPVQNNWATDLTPYYEADSEAALLYDSFVQFCSVKDKLVMIPSAVYTYGVFVNLDLLAANNIEAPSYDWTLDEMVDIARKTTKAGVSLGIGSFGWITEHLGPQISDDIAWGSAWNSTKQQYDCETAWVTAVTKHTELQNSGLDGEFECNKAMNAVDPEADQTVKDEAYAAKAQELVGNGSLWTAFLQGSVAMYADFSWDLSMPTWSEYGGWAWDWYPIPVLTAGDESRPGIVIDSIGITTTCQNPEEAYKLVKFLTYGKEGFDARVSIVENYDADALKAKYPDLTEDYFTYPLSFSQMPTINDQASRDTWAELNNVPDGVMVQVNRFGTGYFDGYKVTPAYNECYFNLICLGADEVKAGTKNAADIAVELQTSANEILAEYMATLG